MNIYQRTLITDGSIELAKNNISYMRSYTGLHSKDRFAQTLSKRIFISC